MNLKRRKSFLVVSAVIALLFFSLSPLAQARSKKSKTDLTYDANAADAPTVSTRTNLSLSGTATASTDLEGSVAAVINGTIDPDYGTSDGWLCDGSNNGSDWLAVTFDSSVYVNQADIYFIDDGESWNVPKNCVLQYLSESGWVDCDITVKPEKYVGNGLTTFKFNAVATTALRIVVTPRDGYYVAVNEIEYYCNPFTVVDVDFSDATATDYSNNVYSSSESTTLYTSGSPTISQSSDLAENAASFDGSADFYSYEVPGNYYDLISDGFSMECMFQADNSTGTIFSSYADNSGLGFELSSGTLEFKAAIGGKEYSVSSDVSSYVGGSDWVHAIATYDGTNLILYIEGEQVASTSVSGALTAQSNTNIFMLGSNLSQDSYFDGEISIARVYTEAMDSSEVAEVYEDTDPVRLEVADDFATPATKSELAAGVTIDIPEATARSANNQYDVSTTVTYVSFNATIGDNLSYTGSNKIIEDVTISNGTFTASEPGKYVITYTASYTNSDGDSETLTDYVEDYVYQKRYIEASGDDDIYVAVASDAHVNLDEDGYEDCSTGKYLKAMNILANMDSEKPLDAILQVGDEADHDSNPDQYQHIIDVGEDIKDETGVDLLSKSVYAVGNHDNASYMEQLLDADRQEVVKIGTNSNGDGGITVIKLYGYTADYTYGNGYGYYPISQDTSTVDIEEYQLDSYAFLKQALEDAVDDNPNAPILVMFHHSIYGTVFGSITWNGYFGRNTEKDMLKLMEQYPQIITLSGHSHSTIEDATSIDQSLGFTCIQDGTISDSIENDYMEKRLPDSQPAYTVVDAQYASQFLTLKISEDHSGYYDVTVNRYNLNTNNDGDYTDSDDFAYFVIYENDPWKFNTGDLIINGNFEYTDDRVNDSNAPVFPDKAEITVTDIDADSVTFAFSQANAYDSDNLFGNSENDMVSYYKFQVTNLTDNIVLEDEDTQSGSYERWSDYYLPTNGAILYQTLHDLEADKEYKIEIWAMTPFDVQSSNSISTTFTTSTSQACDLVFNVDFADGTYAEDSGDNLSTVGSPTISYDEDLNKNVASFDGSKDAYVYELTEADYYQYFDECTLECVFKYDGTSSGALFADYENSRGFSFSIDGNVLTISIPTMAYNGDFYTTSSSYTRVQTYTLSDDLAGKWVDAVAVMTGYEASFYVNGTLIGSYSTKKSRRDCLIYGTRKIYIGADADTSGDPENYCGCDISAARIYGNAMSATQVAALYSASVSNSPAPSISGTETATYVLKAKVSDADAGSTLAYQWYRVANGVAEEIEGANSQTYALTNDEAGSTVYVEVAVTSSTGATVYVSSEPTGTITSSPARVTVSGKARKGTTLTATVTDIDDSATISYQWYRTDDGEDTAIAGATGSTYTLTSGDVGCTVYVVVTATTDVTRIITSGATGTVSKRQKRQKSN